tara:strand:- start:4641 stop:5573 length:933 start_codon:yes stop_codon:yes gene_type:complete
MAGEFSPTGSVNNTTGAVFIPEIWSDEVIAAYKRNLTMANLVNKMSFKGKKGDTLRIPKPTRGVATAKATETQVALQAATETDLTVLVDKHYEYSRMIEDITEVQALASLRKFYTSDAGYALAKQVDTDLIQLGRGANGGTQAATTYTGGIIGSTGAAYTSGSSNAAAIADAGIRKAIQLLDDDDVPMDNRFLVVPPVARNSMMGLARFTEQAFVGEMGGSNTIRNGQIGDVYGVKVFVSTNCDTAAGNTASDRVCLMFHKDAFVLAEQMAVRSQTQYMQQYLATLYTADTLYGVKELRDEACVPLIVLA